MTEAQSRRILVHGLIGRNELQTPGIGFVDSGADCSLISEGALCRVLRIAPGDLTLLPSSWSSIQGIDSEAAPMPSLGRVVLPFEISYLRQSEDLRITDIVSGVQHVTFEVIKGENPFASLVPPSLAQADPVVVIIGSDALIGYTEGIFAQIISEAHSPRYKLILSPIGSRVSTDGYRFGEPAFGSVNEIASIASVSSVPGDPDDSRVGTLADAWQHSVQIAAADAGGKAAPLWPMEEIAARVSTACLSPESRAKLEQIIFGHQPARSFLIVRVTVLAVSNQCFFQMLLLLCHRFEEVSMARSDFKIGNTSKISLNLVWPKSCRELQRTTPTGGFFDFT